MRYDYIALGGTGHNVIARMEVQYSACAPVFTVSVSKYKLAFWTAFEM